VHRRGAGSAPEELGLSSGESRQLVSRTEVSPEIAASQLRWRTERRWLNRHRSELRTQRSTITPVGAVASTDPWFLPSMAGQLGSMYDG
jgi:hypothetical protein